MEHAVVHWGVTVKVNWGISTVVFLKLTMEAFVESTMSFCNLRQSDTGDRDCQSVMRNTFVVKQAYNALSRDAINPL